MLRRDCYYVTIALTRCELECQEWSTGIHGYAGESAVRGTISARFKDSEPPDTLTFRLRDGVPWRYLYDGTNSAQLRC